MSEAELPKAAPAGRGRVAQFALDWLPVVAYMALIWWVSSRRVRVPLEFVPMRDKGVHFVEYAALGTVAARAIVHTWPRFPWRAGVAAVLVTVSWGALDELHQSFVPGRSADVFDVVADALGAVCGVLLFSAWSRRRKSADRPVSDTASQPAISAGGAVEPRSERGPGL